MKVERCRDWRESLGAYVLGQLDQPERAALKAHLEGCPGCRAEAEELAPLARLLALADPARLGPAPQPPPGLGDRVAARIETERRARQRGRRRRFGLALSSAAATAVAAIAIFTVLGSGDDGRAPPAQRVSFGSLPPGAAIAAELDPRPYGTEIRVGVRGLKSGIHCRVFLRRRDGERVQAGSFRYRSGADEAVLTSALDLADASALVLVANDQWTYVARLEGGPAAR